MLKSGNKNRMETESVGKLMWGMCTQTTFSIMLYNVYAITDTFYVSRGVGSLASGAIGIFAPVLVLVGGISSTLGVGGGSIISRKLGKREEDSGREVVGCLIWIWLICALFITAAGLLFLKPVLYLSGCTEEILPYALEYGRIMLLGTVVSTGFSGIMRAEGDIFFSTLQWSFPVIINMILDPLFIYVFHMGIAGAACATLLAQLVSACSSVYYFFVRKSTPCRITRKEIRWNRDIAVEIASVGLPSFLNSIGSSLLVVVWNHMLSLTGGNQAISAFAVISRIQAFLSTPFTGIMQGIQPIIGFDWGRMQMERVRHTVFCAVRACVLYGCILAVLCLGGAEIIVSFFTREPAITGIGVKALKIVGFSFCVSGILPVIQAFYQAVGNGKRVLVLSLGSIFAIRIPVIMIMGLAESMTAMWAAFVLGDVLAAGWALYGYTKTFRQEEDRV